MSTADIPPRLVNLRDVATASPLLRPGVLLRSDAPHSEDEPPGVDAWPPAVVLDLRDAAEKREAHPYSSRSRIVDLPLLGGRARMDPDEVDVEAFLRAGLGGMYVSMIQGQAAALLIRAMEEIARADGAVLVHCTAGKDRTGVTVALALALAGVPYDDIVADYVRTAENMPGVRARAARTVAARTTGTRLALDVPAEILTAPAPAMETFLDALDARGGAESWFRSTGGEPGTVDALHARLRGRGAGSSLTA
ncbi:tyrosine-protein phosphatase [Microbacterium betulae]|uniref:Tyrosine-protein phosphatase n=1 Tax=Microbacterium betulae TaxID=2981139 RepID=A0AA97FHZ5_9MICO|nr:tyrosine-protein phosphatase [Microbacterium sp. AB]WOF23248.1 tyrosine-protein phosphatase [Microbacterium sp. AB]